MKLLSVLLYQTLSEVLNVGSLNVRNAAQFQTIIKAT